MEKISVFDKERVQDLLMGSSYVSDSDITHAKHENFSRVGSANSVSASFTSRESTGNVPVIRDNSEVDSSTCLICNFNLPSRDDQREHYKCDWHRYNLKLKLHSRPGVSQSEFGDIMNEISSISGSDSDDEPKTITETAKDDFMKLDKALNAVTVSGFDDISSLSIAVPTGIAKESSLRSSKVHLKTKNGTIASFYRCIISSRDSQESGDLDIPNLEETLYQEIKCLIILFSAGHFASCVFDGDSVTVHKTFHRYVLRAKQGTVQSVRDGRGNAPKSGGAALRRHNEAALAVDIQNLLNSWQDEHIKNCTHIFLRTPHYGKGVFYNGKNAPFERKDPRIRGIPFPTRRPTFSELKRVFKELFSVTVCDKNDSLLVKEKVAADQSQISKHKDNNMPNLVEPVNEQKGNNETLVSTAVKSSKKQKRRKQIPGKSETQTVASIPNDDEEESKDSVIDELFTVCKVGNLVGLKAILSDLTKTNHIENDCDDVVKLHLNQSVNKEHDTLLHIAAKSAHRDIIQYLLECGSDPANKNNQGVVPYQVASDKTAKNTFRKFMAEWPLRYDYKMAQVPGPLTEDMEIERRRKQQEKKKAQRAMRKEKIKEQKAEKEKLDAERTEQERFAALSDREKRAIAAERRYAQQLSAHRTAAPSNVARCWLCGTSLLGKIPFEYFDYKFCSIACLKKHKSLETVNR